MVNMYIVYKKVDDGHVCSIMVCELINDFDVWLTAGHNSWLKMFGDGQSWFMVNSAFCWRIMLSSG